MHGIQTSYLLNQTDIWINELGSPDPIDMQLDPAPPRTNWLKGYLLDAITGLPLIDEPMTAASSEYLNTTRTNVTGYYNMTFISGEYTMGASSTDYESQSLRFTMGDNWTLWRNITLEPLDCVLKGIIKGSGGPLDNAYVYVEEPWNVNPRNDDYSNYTNAAGYYEMNLTRGTKTVGFRNDGYLATSRPITLHAGDNWLNITMADIPIDDSMIMGFILDFNTFAPINCTSIRVGNNNNSWSNGTWTDSGGYYEIYVIPGDLRIEAENGAWGYQRNGTEISAMAGQIIWQNITLVNSSEPQASIRGYVTLDGATPNGGDIRVTNWNTNFGTGPDGSGYYEMFLSPGYVELTALAYANNNDKSNIERLSLTLQPGEIFWHDFDLYSLDFDSIILGTIENQGGQIVEGAVCFFSNGNSDVSTFESSAISDFQGIYELGYSQGEMVYYMIFQQDYEMLSGNFMVGQEWNWHNFTLTSIGPKITVHGYIQDLDMNPITGHNMMGSTDNWMNWTGTNASGYYEIDVPLGDVYIDAQLANSGFYNPGKMFLNTRSGNDVWLNFSVRSMPLSMELRGRICESGNSNVTGATVTAKYGASEFTAVSDAGGNYILTVPEGRLSLSVRMDGYGHNGDEYISISQWASSLYWQNLTLDKQGAWIELPATDSVVDIDGDGKFDWLYIDVQINIATPGEYDLSGDLYSDYWLINNDGGLFGSNSASASNNSYLNAGLHTVCLEFNGPQIYLMEENGFVCELDLYDRNAGWETIDRQYYFTNPYNSSDFDMPDVDDIDPPHSFGPVDTDFDGLYNLLLFNTTVDILAPGNYTFISQLYNVPGVNNGDRDEIDQIFISKEFDTGIHTLEFAFSGTDIYNSENHLGIASTIMMNGTGDMDQNTMIWASQCYVPYDYTLFQNYPIDSMVYGWANNTGNVPIANLSVEIYNRTTGFINRTSTDATGYYELGGWQGDWLLVMNDGDDTTQHYQGNLTEIYLTTGTPIEENRIIQDEVLDSNEQTIIFDPNDWNKTVIDLLLDILVDNETIRYNFDMYEFGNGDGFISEDEVDMLMNFMGSMLQMPTNLTDYITVDNITYDLDAGSAIYDFGLVGDVSSKEPVYIHQKGNYTAQAPFIPTLSPHDLKLNLTYDDIDTGSISEANSTTICYVYPPTGWGRTGNNNTQNITFSGTDYITIDPGVDPVPGDANESEWTNVTISDSQLPTVGTISGNVTLDGRFTHFGVVITVTNSTTGVEIATGVTDIFGFYSIVGIAAGSYNVTAEKGGYQPNMISNQNIVAGQTTWIVDMVLLSYPPQIFNIKYEASVTITDGIIIYADVKDDGQVGDVTLWYNDVSGVNHIVPMTNLGVTTYKAVISAQGATGTVDFYVMANDTIGNSARNPDPGTHVINIVELNPPVLSNLLVTSDPTEYNDPTNIAVTVTDMSPMASVFLYNHFTITNTSMNDAGGGDYWLEDTFLNLGTYDFTIWATDSFENYDFMDGSFIVQDGTMPVIANVTVEPLNLEFGELVNISADITDLAEITNAWLEIQYPNGTVMSNDTMTSGVNDIYYLMFSCPVIGQYTFTIRAVDGNGGCGWTAGRFWLNDTVLPEISNLTVPAIVELGDEVNITADVDDLGGLDNVAIQMFGPDGIELFNETMNIGSYWWSFTPAELGIYNFTLWATDGNDLINSSQSSFSVTDTTAPSFTSVIVLPTTHEVFGYVDVRAIVDDLNSVDSVFLNITSPNGTWLENVSMSQSGNVWTMNQTYVLLGDYSFTIWASDPSGNGVSYTGTISTEDTQSPEAIAGIDQTVNVGILVNFNAGGSSDNYEIANYTWEFTDNGVRTLYGEVVSWTFNTPGTYTIALAITDLVGYTDADEIVITVNDVVTTGTVTGTVFDSDGYPISEVTVYIEGFPSIEDTTDNAGRYTLENVPQGNQTIVFFHSYYERATEIVEVVAGSTVTALDISLVEPSLIDGDICFLGLLLLFIPIIFMLYKRKKAAGIPNAVIDEIFFMSTDGRLIRHFTRRLKPDMDQDILSGMLVAVQDFIKDSFRGEEGGLDELKFGKFQIVMGRGKYTIIAASILGEDMKPFRPQVEKCLKDIEDEFGDILDGWDGDVENLTGTFKYLTNLIDGKYI